jgi:hypothetical protein
MWWCLNIWICSYCSITWKLVIYKLQKVTRTHSFILVIRTIREQEREKLQPLTYSLIRKNIRDVLIGRPTRKFEALLPEETQSTGFQKLILLWRKCYEKISSRGNFVRGKIKNRESTFAILLSSVSPGEELRKNTTGLNRISLTKRRNKPILRSKF